MDSLGRAFLGRGGVWCPGGGWGLQHPQPQQGEVPTRVRSVGNGCQLQQERGTGWNTHCWDGCEPKAGHSCDSQMGLWHTFPMELPAQLSWMLQPAQGAHEVEFRKTIPPQWLFPASLTGSSSGSAWLEALPFRSHPEKTLCTAPQEVQLSFIQKHK